MCVDLQVCGFDREPDSAAGAEGEVGDRCGGDVDEGGRPAVEVEPDAVGEQGRPAMVAGQVFRALVASGRWVLTRTDEGRMATRTSP